MTTSPAARVFRVAELLEMILVSLPPKNLLLVQRVSKDFRNGVKSSKRLQEILFFKAGKFCGADFRQDADDASAEAIMAAACAKSKWLAYQNKCRIAALEESIIQDHHVPANLLMFRGKKLDGFHNVGTLPPSYLKSFHPAIAKMSLSRKDGERRIFLHVHLEAQPSPNDATAPPADSRASWRQMLVVHCPCTFIRLRLQICGQGVASDVSEKVFSTKSTMGEIMDWCASTYAIFRERRGLGHLECGDREEDEEDDSEDEDYVEGAGDSGEDEDSNGDDD